MENIIEQIKATIEKISPFLQNDGGDIEFVDFKDGIVYVKMKGACIDCIHLDTTIKDGVELMLMDEVPGILAVEVVKERLLDILNEFAKIHFANTKKILEE